MKHAIRFFLVILALSPAMAYAAGDAPHAPEQDWSFSGPFGTYDKASLQRGLLVYRQVCAVCHSMKHLFYRDLEALGYDEGQIKAIAAEYTVTDGPDDEGEMFERPARPSDKFKSPFANEKQAKAANNGALPPDLSLITKARHGGADYVHAILTGYEEAPEHVELLPGQNYNKYMPGHIIAMASPLMDDQIAYEDGSPQTVDQYAKDVAHFLTWAADPYMEDRKRTGIKVILFLLAFAAVMYAVKRKTWADQH
ncbi:MAG: cytochrome c1 [Alphaproteobacteria bacterium]|nr:cytochrome c1 [Alphaproteobacteria bacterium]MCD8520246.1 cytochrome c1 [Alphaproteobacteria bacterium]MCD8570326.1 cytochrome c1 [Alphaproteobacteria bacterium]